MPVPMLDTPQPLISSAPPPVISSKTRILLVEDNPIDALFVKRALSGTGVREMFGPEFEVEAAESLASAMSHLDEAEIDVVLLDLGLPDSKEYEDTFNTLRGHAPNVPIIVLTGLGDEGLGVKMMRNGAQDYLTKGKIDRYLLVKAILYAMERKRAEQALRESEEKFRSLVETTSEWIWSIDLEGRLNYSNPAVATILGYLPAEIVGKPNYRLLHPEDRRKFEVRLAEAALHQTGWSGLVLRWQHRDGTYRWLESNSAPLWGIGGQLLGFRGSDRDITERERAKQERIDLQLRMVTVQEEERQRIARELHDQMGQSLAALMLGLKPLVTSGNLEPSTRHHLKRLHDLANDLAKDVHHLALDLRPTALDDLGLQIALSNYVEEFSERWKIPADFHANGFDGERLPSHLETTVYRVVQEALSNILKHADAKRISVILEHRSGRLVVIVEDDGCGFDAEGLLKLPVRARRLGLLGMQERVALVGGSLAIESSLGSGTSLYVRIPTSAHQTEVPTLEQITDFHS
jgi:two-component system, NarL family, sensor histidine kinase UhpB